MSMLTHRFKHVTPDSPMQQEGLDLSLSLYSYENCDLACGTPARFAPAVTTERAFIALKTALKGLPALFQLGAAGAKDAMQGLQRRGTRPGPEALPKHKDTVDNGFQYLELLGFGKTVKSPGVFPRELAAAPTTFETTIGKTPSSRVRTLWAFPHVQTCPSHILFG